MTLFSFPLLLLVETNATKRKLESRGRAKISFLPSLRSFGRSARERLPHAVCGCDGESYKASIFQTCSISVDGWMGWQLGLGLLLECPHRRFFLATTQLD